MSTRVGDGGMGGERIEELGPLAGAAGVRRVAGDENRVERRRGVDVLELPQQPAEAIIALRARPAALDAEAIALADDVNVGQVRDAPSAGAGRRLGKTGRSRGGGHRRIGEPPHERGDGEIGADDDHGVGERDPGELRTATANRSPRRSSATTAKLASTPAGPAALMRRPDAAAAQERKRSRRRAAASSGSARSARWRSASRQNV